MDEVLHVLLFPLGAVADAARVLSGKRLRLESKSIRVVRKMVLKVESAPWVNTAC